MRARTTSDQGPIRVLIVDDHVVPRAGLRRLLSREPDILVVGEAIHGQQALEVLAQKAPHVVLMDIRMPIMNGIAATRIIGAEHEHVHVIGMSFGPADEDAPAMCQAGAALCIDKGDMRALLAAIHGWRDEQRRNE